MDFLQKKLKVHNCKQAAAAAFTGSTQIIPVKWTAIGGLTWHCSHIIWFEFLSFQIGHDLTAISLQRELIKFQNISNITLNVFLKERDLNLNPESCFLLLKLSCCIIYLKDQRNSFGQSS